jgi:hypothetical protein
MKEQKRYQGRKDGAVAMIRCPYQDCKRKDVTSTEIKTTHREGKLVCTTYECYCRECGGVFTTSINV